MLDDMGLFSASPDPALNAKIARIEKKLDVIMQSLGLSLPQDDLDDVRALISQGKKIQAIKLYRERTGCQLYEAKQAIDAGL